jgi:hypothetical protein
MAIQTSGWRPAPVNTSRQDVPAEKSAPTQNAAKDVVPEGLGTTRGSTQPNNYGSNGYAGPSSISHGQRIEESGARLARNADPDLEAVRTGAYGVGSQIRDIGQGNVGTTFGCTGASRGPTIPNKIGGGVAPLPSVSAYKSGTK